MKKMNLPGSVVFLHWEPELSNLLEGGRLGAFTIQCSVLCSESDRLQRIMIIVVCYLIYTVVTFKVILLNCRDLHKVQSWF